MIFDIAAITTINYLIYQIHFYIFHSTKYEKTLKSQKWQNILNLYCINMQNVDS